MFGKISLPDKLLNSPAALALALLLVMIGIAVITAVFATGIIVPILLAATAILSIGTFATFAYKAFKKLAVYDKAKFKYHFLMTLVKMLPLISMLAIIVILFVLIAPAIIVSIAIIPIFITVASITVGVLMATTFYSLFKGSSDVPKLALAVLAGLMPLAIAGLAIVAIIFPAFPILGVVGAACVVILGAASVYQKIGSGWEVEVGTIPGHDDTDKGLNVPPEAGSGKNYQNLQDFSATASVHTGNNPPADQGEDSGLKP